MQNKKTIEFLKLEHALWTAYYEYEKQSKEHLKTIWKKIQDLVERYGEKESE